MASPQPSKAFVQAMAEAMASQLQDVLNPQRIPTFAWRASERKRVTAFFKRIARNQALAEQHVGTLRSSLVTITQYMTPAQLERRSEKEYGLSYAEGLVAAYENIQIEAKGALRLVPRRKART